MRNGDSFEGQVAAFSLILSRSDLKGVFQPRFSYA